MASTLADLDAALAAFETAQTAVLAEINGAVTQILAKISPAVDVSAEVTRIQNAQAALKSAADAINAEANPPPPPLP